MDEHEYRKQHIELEKEKLKLEREKISLENKTAEANEETQKIIRRREIAVSVFATVSTVLVSYATVKITSDASMANVSSRFDEWMIQALATKDKYDQDKLVKMGNVIYSHPELEGKKWWNKICKEISTISCKPEEE